VQVFSVPEAAAAAGSRGKLLGGSDMSPPPPPLPPPGAGDDVVFMRWKEKSFETGYGEGCGLTIAVSITKLVILSPSQSGNPH